jgi:hypothetical protein
MLHALMKWKFREGIIFEFMITPFNFLDTLVTKHVALKDVAVSKRVGEYSIPKPQVK